MTSDEELHALARATAERLKDPDRKQLRFNDIVRVARAHYLDPREGVRDLVLSCEKSDPAHVKGKPMWAALETDYAWMTP